MQLLTIYLLNLKRLLHVYEFKPLCDVKAVITAFLQLHEPMYNFISQRYKAIWRVKASASIYINRSSYKSKNRSVLCECMVTNNECGNTTNLHLLYKEFFSAFFLHPFQDNCYGWY